MLPAALLAVGLVAGPLRSAEWSWRSPILAEVDQLSELEPVRALPRTAAVLATLEARRFMATQRPYAAWLTLRDYVDEDGPAGATAALLAAEAAAGWDSWSNVREILGDKPWIETMSGGEGLLLLGRANAELGNPNTATEQLRRYLALPNAARRGEAATRLGNLLADRGAHAEAAEAFELAAAELPVVSDWLQSLYVRELVEAGDTAATTVATGMVGGAPPVRMRRVQLEARAWETDARTGRAIERLEWEARVLDHSGAHTEAGTLRIDQAELFFATDRSLEGRNLLAFIAAESNVAARVRLRAARRLDQIADLSSTELLAIADGYEAGGESGLAARSLRLAFERGIQPTAEQQLRYAHLLYDERDYSVARSAFLNAARRLSDPALRAEAQLLAARSLFRTGSRGRSQALDEIGDVADSFPETPAAGTALFLLGDEASTIQSGLNYYRRAADVTSSPDAREALFRVGDRNLRIDRTSSAIDAWTEYVERYPRGDETARVAYETGKLHERAGRSAQAREMFAAAIAAEPTSYYAVRAGEKLGVDPLAATLTEPRPWSGLASDEGDAAEHLRRIDALDALGLSAEASAEIDYATRTLQGRPLALVTFAEGLRDRERPVEAIRIARSLREGHDGQWDERLLKIVFPLLYRDIIVIESRRADVDPLLYAALVRQESTFRHDVKSWVGATGLGQIMPSTGRWLASSLGIQNYEESMLQVPELNVRMGANYFGDLLRRYRGEADLALAGYNAGPSRADRWRRTLGHGGDVDTFREAIPFDETRNYVMIVLRNAAIYRSLYGDQIGD